MVTDGFLSDEQRVPAHAAIRMAATLPIGVASDAENVSRRTTKGQRFDELFPAPVAEFILRIVRTLAARHFIVIGYHRSFFVWNMFEKRIYILFSGARRLSEAWILMPSI